MPSEDFGESMERREEVRLKKARLTQFLKSSGLEAVVLGQVSNFSWFTAGGSDVVAQSSETGPAVIFFDTRRAVIIADCIETPRLVKEELPAGEFEVITCPWQDVDRRAKVLGLLTRSKKVATDLPNSPGWLSLSEEFDQLRYVLTDAEVERFRKLGRLAAQAVEETCLAVKPGQSEFEVAGVLGNECWSRGVSPIVVLVAADNRISEYRHPLPTAKKIKKHLMIVLCGRRWGLVAAVTRIVHFGKIPENLRRKHEAVCKVDTALITGSVPGRTLGEILQGGIAAYRETGFPEEWLKHHQGGLIGYNPREKKATLKEALVIRQNMAVAWNPSITGTKSEDTVLILPDGPRNVTRTGRFPVIRASWKGKVFERPLILER